MTENSFEKIIQAGTLDSVRIGYYVKIIELMTIVRYYRGVLQRRAEIIY